jgi:hypothetical protein
LLKEAKDQYAKEVMLELAEEFSKAAELVAAQNRERKKN